MVYLKVVAYLRLSRKEDGNDESVSIANQKKIISQYAKENGLFVSEWYIDDGVSGYTFDRPDFNRLKTDLQNDKVDIVIVKDLSRIGRHNAKTLLFIEELTNLNKQLIVINDDFNNLEDDDSVIGIKTWFNELYIKDCSKKVRNAIAALQSTGEWISMIPYGYKRIYGRKKSFEIDPITSQYVKKIFDLYVNGSGGHTIARILTDEGIPTPTQTQNIQREELGLEPYKNEAKTWSSIIVRRIIKNEFYIGTLVQNKTKTIGINGKKTYTDKEKHIKFPNHHEAIIDEQTFYLAQQLMQDRDRNKYRGNPKYTNTFSGMIFCAKCGKTMTPCNGSQKETFYVCRTYHTLGIKYCDHNKVFEKDIMNALRVYLMQCRQSLADNIEQLDNTIKKELKQIGGSGIVNALDQLEERLKKTDKELKSLITQKTKEIIKNPDMSDIIEDTYREMINEKMMQVKSLKTQIEDQKEIAKSSKDVRTNLKTALDIFDDIIINETMTKKQISTLVERIDVHYEKGLAITMRGNLNAVIDPEAIITLNRELAYIKAAVDKMYNDGEFYYKDVVEHLRSNGYNYGYYRTFKPLANRLIEMGIIQKGETNVQKTKFIKPIEEAYTMLGISTVVEPDPRVITNRAELEDLILISKWIQQMHVGVGRLSKIV